MGIGKLIGYIIAIIGVIIIAIGSIPSLRTTLTFIPSQIKDFYLMILGLIIAAIGVIPIIKSGSSQKVQEVPIYHGKDVVGFRRLGKK